MENICQFFENGMLISLALVFIVIVLVGVVSMGAVAMEQEGTIGLLLAAASFMWAALVLVFCHEDDIEI